MRVRGQHPRRWAAVGVALLSCELAARLPPSLPSSAMALPLASPLSSSAALAASSAPALTALSPSSRVRRPRAAAVLCAASSPRDAPLPCFRSGAAALGAVALVLLSNAGPSPLALAAAVEPGTSEFQTYYGTAASASSYGGYGGNANKKDSAEYVFDVPQVLLAFHLPEFPYLSRVIADSPRGSSIFERMYRIGRGVDGMIDGRALEIFQKITRVLTAYRAITELCDCMCYLI